MRLLHGSGGSGVGTGLCGQMCDQVPAFRKARSNDRCTKGTPCQGHGRHGHGGDLETARGRSKSKTRETQKKTGPGCTQSVIVGKKVTTQTGWIRKKSSPR